jgi:ELWxxDGT repeat protein
MTSLRGNLLYVNNDGVHGSELYRSDGTQAGTTLVKDINTGPASSAIGAAARGYNYLNDTPCIFRNVAYFGANDGVHGVELGEATARPPAPTSCATSPPDR